MPALATLHIISDAWRLLFVCGRLDVQAKFGLPPSMGHVSAGYFYEAHCLGHFISEPDYQRRYNPIYHYHAV